MLIIDYLVPGCWSSICATSSQGEGGTHPVRRGAGERTQVSARFHKLYIIFELILPLILNHWTAGVDISPKYDIFVPHPFFLKLYFSPEYSENFPFSPSSTFYSCFFWIKHKDFPPIQPITHIFAKMKIYTPLHWSNLIISGLYTFYLNWIMVSGKQMAK